MDRQAPHVVAQEIYRERYPAADCLFLAGSVLRNEATRFSDLDIVVLFGQLANAYRESFTFSGWPIEAFVHDLSTLTYFFEQDKARGKPSLPHMVMEGVVIPAKTNLANEVQTLAKQILSDGPCDLDAKSIERTRYFITDLINDLREPRSHDEAQATATQLYGAIANFYLRYNKQWSTDGKSIPRQLKRYDPDFYRRFSHAFEQLFVHGNNKDLLALSESVLEPVGGFLFDGVRIDAPRDWRR